MFFTTVVKFEERLHKINFSVLFLSPEDDVQKIVSVCVDGKESQLVFIDHAHTDMSVSSLLLGEKDRGR